MLAADATHQTQDDQAALSVQSLAPLPPSKQRHIIDSLCEDEYIASRVRHDLRKPGFIDHPAVEYFGAYVRGKLAGAYFVVKVSAIEVDLHALLLRSAARHSRQLARMIFACIFSNPSINRITAQIREGLESVRNHCIKVGFKYEGFRRGACLLDGRPVGLHILGLTRDDWRDA